MKNLKSYILPGIILLSIVAYRIYLKSRPVEIPKYGNYLSCIGHAYDLDVKLKGEVYLPASALPESDQEKIDLYREAAFYQNLYAFTNILEHNPSSTLKWITFGTKMPKIDILGTEKIVYPQDIEFESNAEISGFPPVAENYLKRLMPLEKVSKGEPAVKVNYELESELLTCFTEPNPKVFSSLKIFHPYDPYLAYFYVPKSHRMKVVNPVRLNAEGIYNPCLNPDGVTSSGFNPFGFWYFWRPDAKGHSKDKVPFDCSLFYQEGKNLKLVQVEVQESAPEKAQYFDFKKFEELKRPVKVSLLIGAIEGAVFPKLNPDDVKKFVDLYLSDISLHDARKQLPAEYDSHFSKVLVLLYKLRNHLDIYNKEVNAGDLYADIILRGKLKLSKKDIELKISLSPNDPRYEGSDHFSSNFANDFLTNDIVIYEGHATVGTIFNDGLKKLKEQNLSKQDKSIAYQIFAIYSCSSTFYYHPSRFPKVENPEFRRDVVRTAGAYFDAGGNGSLGLIASLDQYLYNESYVPFAYWAKNYKSDNFYILSNH